MTLCCLHCSDSASISRQMVDFVFAVPNKSKTVVLQCIPGRGVYRMVERLFEDPPYVMITGPILSTIATAVAEVSYHWNVTQVTKLLSHYMCIYKKKT